MSGYESCGNGSSETVEVRELGRVAFEAYAESVGGRTHDGKPIPGWHDVTPAVREGWRDAADAVIGAVADELEKTFENVEKKFVRGTA